MVSYPFKKQDPVEQKSRTENVTTFEMMKRLFFTFVLGCNVFYVQYLIFYKNATDREVPSIYYLIFTIVSSTVTMPFVIRIYIINQTQEFRTIITVLVVCANYSVPIKVLYSVIFAPVVLFLHAITLVPQVIFTKYAVMNKLAGREDGRQTMHNSMMQYGTASGLVSILDCYLRAAPQMIIQLAIILRGDGDMERVSVPQICFILMAFVMMPWSATSFHGSLRHQCDNEFTCASWITYFLWHFFIMVSRIVSISGAIAFWPCTTLVVTLVHWTAATIWIWCTTELNEFCDMKKTWHFLFCCVFGAVYFFNPVNLGKKPTFSKNAWFCTVILIEHILAIIGWIYEEKHMKIEWEIGFVVIIAGSFIVGIICMIFYYTLCHPTMSYQRDIVIYKISSQIIENESV